MPCLEHDCLERYTRRIGAEFARNRLSERLDNLFWIDAATRSYLIYEGIAEHKRSGISSDIGNYLAEAQYCNSEIGKPGSSQRILDRV